MSRQWGATYRINWASASDVVTIVWQVDKQIVLFLKMSLSLWQSLGKCVRQSTMFITGAFQQGVLSKCLLYLDPSEVAHLRDTLCSTCLNVCVIWRHFLVNKLTPRKVICRAEEREERGGRSKTPVATMAGGWCALIYEGKQSGAVSPLLLRFYVFHWLSKDFLLFPFIHVSWV